MPKRRRGDWLSIFIVASVTVHVIGAAAVAFIPPLREMVFGVPKARPPQRIPGDMLRPLAQSRLRNGAQAIRQEKATIERMVREMDALSAPLLAKFRETRGERFLKDLSDELKSIAKKVTPQASKGPWPNNDEGLMASWQELKEAEAKVVNSYQILRAARLMQKKDEPLEGVIPAAKVECPDRREPDAVTLTMNFVDSLDPNIDKFRKEVETLEGDAKAVTGFAKKLMDIARAAERLEQEGINMMTEDAEAVKTAYNAPTLMPDELVDGNSYQAPPQGMVPCRRIVGAKGYKPGKGSMFFGDWYWIGPFDNSGRRNMNTRFLPEVGVDLDATYAAKDGRQVSWTWLKTDNPVIKPEQVTRDSIWYYTTEVYVDADVELWLAMGSDDYGKLWVNDKLIWVSPKEPKPYNWSETVMAVPFKKGYNRVMFRLENAGGDAAFSVIVMMGQQE